MQIWPGPAANRFEKSESGTSLLFIKLIMSVLSQSNIIVARPYTKNGIFMPLPADSVGDDILCLGGCLFTTLVSSSVRLCGHTLLQ